MNGDNYRPDLDVEDRLNEAERSRQDYGRVRGVLELPFAFGTPDPGVLIQIW